MSRTRTAYSRKPEHRQTRALGTSALGLSVLKKEKLENDKKFWSSGPGVLEVLKSTAMEGHVT